MLDRVPGVRYAWGMHVTITAPHEYRTTLPTVASVRVRLDRMEAQATCDLRVTINLLLGSCDQRIWRIDTSKIPQAAVNTVVAELRELGWKVSDPLSEQMIISLP